MIEDLVRPFQEGSRPATYVDEDLEMSVSKQFEDSFVFGGLFPPVECVI